VSPVVEHGRWLVKKLKSEGIQSEGVMLGWTDVYEYDRWEWEEWLRELNGKKVEVRLSGTSNMCLLPGS
jgi:hypothetical protein